MQCLTGFKGGWFMPKIGVDTLKVGTQNFIIEDSSRLQYISNVSMETGEVLNEKLTFNSKKLHITIKGNYLTVSTSVPKFLGLDSNFYLLGAGSFKGVIPKLERELADVGVVADLDSLKVLRLDIVSNALTSETFSSYAPVLRTLGLKRTHSRQYGVDTFLMHNTQRELEFYNKLRELAQKKGNAYVRQLGFNSERIVRGELRLLKHREVKAKLNLETLQEIPDNWGTLKEFYVNFMGSEVFTVNFNNERVSEESLTLMLLKMYGGRAFKMLGFAKVFDFNEKMLREALLETMSRRQAYNIIQQIRRAKKELLPILSSANYKKLYSELQYKFTN
jgi:hypothetical protein